MRRLLWVVLINILCITVVSAGQAKESFIRGKVSDMSGKALAGASVTIANSFIGVHTDSNGTYVLPGLKDGYYSLSFSFIGYETRIEDVNLNCDMTLNISLSEKPFQTEEVLVSAMRAGEHTPLAYSTIGKDLLKKQNSGYDMPYLLSLTPSFVETSEAGNGIGYTSLRIRGTDANRINVTIDGIPLNDAESQQVFWVDLPDLASSVENIQVQRGAGTSSNGSGAFGATISLKTVNPDNEPFAEITASAGSYNTLKNTVSAGTGMLGGKFGLNMRYSEIKSDGYIERTGSRHRSENISCIFRSGNSIIKANILLGDEHTGIGWWGVPKEMLTVDRRYNPAGEYTDESGNIKYYKNESDNYRQDHLQLIYIQKLGDFLSLHTALHYTKGKGYYEEYREDQNYSDYGLQSVTIGDSVMTHTDLIRRKWMSNDFYGLVFSVKYQKERMEATVGGGMNQYLGDHFGKIIWMQYAGDTEKDYQWYFNNSRKGEISLYGKINYSLSEKTSIFGDIQYRHILYEMKGIDDDLKDIGQEHRFGFFNPKAGFFYSINPDQDAYLSFSVAHREPTRTDFKEASGDPASAPKSETLYDSELGYKLRTAKTSLAVNLYGMVYRDQLVPTGELSDVGYSIMTNVKNSYRMGVEFVAGIKPVDFFGWDMNLTLSRNRIRNFEEYYTDYNTSDGSSQYLSRNLGEVDIAYSPPVITTSDLRFKIHKWTEIHLISKIVGKQYVDNTMSPDRMIDPYFVNNIRLDYEPEIRNFKSIQLQILVNNIFNEVYESNGYGGNWYEDGVEKSWSYYFPQAGTNFIIKIGLKF
jgi:iron complex outermembrane recepter protein